jgi:hypothetical protein
MDERPDFRSWIFTLIVGGGFFVISVVVFVLSYLRLRSP